MEFKLSMMDIIERMLEDYDVQSVYIYIYM